MPNTVVTSVDTAAEALAVSIAEKARVDMPYMSELTGKSADELAADLRGVIFQIPEPAKSDGSVRYVTADEYLSGNVREKLRIAEAYAADNPAFSVNVEALTAAQPKKLEAHEIDVRLGATWIDKEYIQQFMLELLNPAFYHRRKISTKACRMEYHGQERRFKQYQFVPCLRYRPDQRLPDFGRYPEPP